MAVQFIASLSPNSFVTVAVRALGSPFKSQKYPERCFLKVVDATDVIFVTGLGQLGSMLMMLKRGQDFKLTNVRVENNYVDFVNRAPFNQYRLVVTPETVLEMLPKNYPGLPPVTEGSIKYLELMATEVIQTQDKPFKFVKISAVDDMDNTWKIKMHGPFYRQWMLSLRQNDLPFKMVLKGVEKDEENVHLLPRSEIHAVDSAQLSSEPLTSSSEEPHSCDSDSKKRKRDSSSDSESTDEGERAHKRLKVEEKPAVSPDAVTANSDDVQQPVDRELTTWQVGNDQVLVITSKEHFDRMARAQQASLMASERKSSIWKSAVRVGFLAAVTALGGLYVIGPEKIVVFLSLANFFKIIV